MVRKSLLFAAALCAAALFNCVIASDEDPEEHQFKLYDKVPVVANKVSRIPRSRGNPAKRSLGQ